MAAVPAGMGLGSALKGASQQAIPAFATSLGTQAGNVAGGAVSGQQGSQPSPLPTMPPPPPPFQIQPIVSSGSSAAPLSFSGAGATPANNMNPQILRLIQMLGALPSRGG